MTKLYTEGESRLLLLLCNITNLNIIYYEKSIEERPLLQITSSIKRQQWVKAHEFSELKTIDTVIFISDKLPKFNTKIFSFILNAYLLAKSVFCKRQIVLSFFKTIHRFAKTTTMVES